MFFSCCLFVFLVTLSVELFFVDSVFDCVFVFVLSTFSVLHGSISVHFVTHVVPLYSPVVIFQHHSTILRFPTVWAKNPMKSTYSEKVPAKRVPMLF